MFKKTGPIAISAFASFTALAAPVAEADSASANLGVSVTVASTCTIAVGSLGFGTYDPLAAGQVDGSATISVACTKGSAAAITLGQGLSPATASSDAAPSRRLTSGHNYLAYSLYSDAARTTSWGNTAATARAYQAESGLPTRLTVYGRIAGHQDATAGSFTDIVVATITF